MRKGNFSQDALFVRRVKKKEKKVLVTLTWLTHDTKKTELDEIHVNAHIKCSLSLTFFMKALSYSMKCQFWLRTHYFILIVDPFSSRVTALSPRSQIYFLHIILSFPFAVSNLFCHLENLLIVLWATSISGFKGYVQAGVLTDCWLLLQSFAGECKICQHALEFPFPVILCH